MADKSDAKEIVEEVGELEAEQEVAPPKPHLPTLEVPEIASGRIFIFLICFYAIAFSLRFFVFTGPSLLTFLKHFAKPTGQPVPHTPSILIDCFLWLCFCCQFIPLPTIPPIAFTAKAFHWVLVAAVSAAGTCIANLNDYAILGYLFRHKRVKKIRDLNAYRKLLKFFDKHAFLTLVVGTFLPIPIDVVRLLAISRVYSFWKYIAATFVGRFPRYLIIAYAGRELPVKYILILFLVSMIPGIIKFISDMIKKRKKT